MAEHLAADALCLVAALLDYEDLQALRSTCRPLRLDPTLRDARQSMLTIPPTDRNRARKLIQGLLADDPQRMSRFTWIQVATVWHVDLLVEFGVGNNVQIDTIRHGDHEATVEILGSLTRLDTLRRLDVTRSSLQDGTVIVFMPQLQELRVSGRRLQDLSFLAALTNLEVLYIDQTAAQHIGAIENLVELQELHLEQGFFPRTPVLEVPSLRRLTKLHTLNMWGCIIDSAEDLYGAASSLKRLQIAGVCPRFLREIPKDPFSVVLSPEAKELACRLTQIESVEWGDILDIEGAISDKELELSAPLMTTLKTIDSFVTENYSAFEKLQNLEKIMIKARRAEQLEILLKLPRLHEIGLDLYLTTIEDDPESNEETQALVKALHDVLVQLPQIKRLSVQGFVDDDQQPPIRNMSHLEHLQIAYETPEPMSLDWLADFTSLRSLELIPPIAQSNANVISQLPQLQDLVLRNVQFDCSSHNGFDFLRPLVKLTKLTLEGDHIHDLQFLEGMIWLTELTIESQCTKVEMKNVDTLRRLTRLRVLNITKTNIHNVSCLLSLSQLRTVHIPLEADCRPLVEADHPKLLGVLHDHRNCLWDLPHERSDGNARKRIRSC